MTRPRRPPTNVPTALTSAGDPNRHLGRWKASLAKRWSLTRMREMFEAVELAWCFLALGREDDTNEVVTALAAVSFMGDYNFWTPAGYAICLHARLGRRAGDAPAWEAAMARIRAHPVNSTTNPQAARRILDNAPTEIERGRREPSLVFARKQLGTALMELNYYQECGLATIDHGVDYDPQTLESPLRYGLVCLRERLAAGPRRGGVR